MRMHKCKFNDPLCLRKPRLLGCICGKGGGSSTTVYQPTPPPQPNTADAINAWVEAMPEVFALQQEFAPQEAALQLQLAQQYAQPMGEAFAAAQRAMYPETAALQEDLAAQATEGMEGGMPDWMKEQYRSTMAANLGTNVGSGIGADYMSRGLLQQEQNYRDYYRNLALSVSGRQPLASPQMPQTSQYTQGFTPGGVMNFMTSGYAPFAAASRPMMMQNQQGQNPLWGVLGAGLGAAGMAMSSKRYKKDIQLWVKG